MRRETAREKPAIPHLIIKDTRGNYGLQSALKYHLKRSSDSTPSARYLVSLIDQRAWDYRRVGKVRKASAAEFRSLYW